MLNTRLALIAVASTGFLTIAAACSPTAGPVTVATAPSASQAGSVASALHNEADVQFAQMMIIHHVGATDMAGLAQQTSNSRQVRELAERINLAQGPEINQMRGWLEEWGEPGPEDSNLRGASHDGMEMGGFDQKDEAEELLNLDGAAFDKKFLNLMVVHHRSALAMANQQITKGQNAEAIELAKTIMSAQESEIVEMENLLNELA